MGFLTEVILPRIMVELSCSSAESSLEEVQALIGELEIVAESYGNDIERGE